MGVATIPSSVAIPSSATIPAATTVPAVPSPTVLPRPATLVHATASVRTTTPSHSNRYATKAYGSACDYCAATPKCSCCRGTPFVRSATCGGGWKGTPWTTTCCSCGTETPVVIESILFKYIHMGFWGFGEKKE